MRTLITCTTLLLKIVAFILVNISHAVPPDYCLQNLNKSDCSVSPIRVFSYYKPGSRCELEVWRGCPTDNLFRTESACINTCIRHKGWNYEKGVTKFVSEKSLNEEKCQGTVNINKCNSNATRAFVYNKTTNECDEIIWTGCQHKGNVFEEQLDCLQTCYRGDLNWNDKISIIPNNLANELDTILDNISLDGEDANIKILLHKTVTKNDDHFTGKIVEENFVETTSTPTLISSKKNTEYATTKVLGKTTESLNYSPTAKYLVTTHKSKYTKITSPKYTLTPKTTAQTKVESTTSEVITTRTEFTSPEATTTTKITTTTDGTTTDASTPQATTPEVTTTKATTTDATTPKNITTKVTTSEATSPETTTTITTVEEKTAVKTTTVSTGTAKEVVLPQDLYN